MGTLPKIFAYLKVPTQPLVTEHALMGLSSAERPPLSLPLLYDSYGPRVWVQGDILVYGLRLRSKFFYFSDISQDVSILFVD